MKDDIRLSELRFLQSLTDGAKLFNQRDAPKFNLDSGNYYLEMAATLLEELYIRFRDQDLRAVVWRLRGEIAPDFKPGSRLDRYQWNNPRESLHEILRGSSLHDIELTYRGLRRIQELSDILRAERILEPFGILMSMQYFRQDFQDALRSGPDVPVSVIYADMDNFKRVNTEFGQNGGDEVMKGYLRVVNEKLGFLGTGYRGVGDEVAALVIGQGHDRAVEIAETIREGVAQMRCEYKGQKLPAVTASIGVASTPPESRAMEMEEVAQLRKQVAKDEGKDRVVSA